MQGGGSLPFFCQLEKERPLKANPALWTGEAKQFQKFELILFEMNCGLTQLHDKHSIEQALLGQTICKRPALSLVTPSPASSRSSLETPQNCTHVPQA